MFDHERIYEYGGIHSYDENVNVRDTDNNDERELNIITINLKG